MKLRKILDKYNISWSWGDTGQTHFIHACELATPLHGYGNWTGDPKLDYDWNKELLALLDPCINNGHVYIIGCDECFGCGDW